MSINDNKAAVRDFWSAMNKGDLDTQLRLCGEDVVFTVSGTTGASGI